MPSLIGRQQRHSADIPAQQQPAGPAGLAPEGAASAAPGAVSGRTAAPPGDHSSDPSRVRRGAHPREIPAGHGPGPATPRPLGRRERGVRARWRESRSAPSRPAPPPPSPRPCRLAPRPLWGGRPQRAYLLRSAGWARLSSAERSPLRRCGPRGGAGGCAEPAPGRTLPGPRRVLRKAAFRPSAPCPRPGTLTGPGGARTEPVLLAPHTESRVSHCPPVRPRPLAPLRPSPSQPAPWGRWPGSTGALCPARCACREPVSSREPPAWPAR